METIPVKIGDLTKRSLEGIWVGDCVGNLGQLYFAHDILKALEGGLAKFGGALGQFHKQFQYSDDTEEAIVLYNHLNSNQKVVQDKLAMEFATRYMERDPDGEIYGYGLNTRKVLRDIYNGVPWSEANKIIKKSEGMPSHIDSLVDSLSKGKGFKDAMQDVNARLIEQRKEQEGKKLEGSCGNGSAMRVAPLGPFLAQRGVNDFEPNEYGLTPDEVTLITSAYDQAEITHCHEEGLAGSIAIAGLSYLVTKRFINPEGGPHSVDKFYEHLLLMTPPSQVAEGIKKARGIPVTTPIGKVIEVIGNGTHVTCQDTVPLCVYLSLKHLSGNTNQDEIYEKAIVETSMAFGDVDTNCAIVGGIVGIVNPPPAKWKQFCQPMEGVIC